MLAAAVLIASPTVVRGPVAPVGGAMTAAVAEGCFLHAAGLSPIMASRRKELAAAGLIYVDAPPADITRDVAHGVPAVWGRPGFAKVAWPGGDAWVVGFAGGQCLMDAKDADGAALVEALRAQFETPGLPWRKLSPVATPERYAAAVRPPGKEAIAIVANVVGMDLPPAGRREVVTFETTPNK